MPQMALANQRHVLHRNMSPIIVMHTPCLVTGMILNPQSFPNTWPRLNPLNTVSYEVCRSFSVQLVSFTASTRPTNPVTSITTFKTRHNSRSIVLHPLDTNFLTSLSNQVSNVTTSRQAPSGNPSSKLTSTVPKRQSTLQKSSGGPRKVSEKKQQRI